MITHGQKAHSTAAVCLKGIASPKLRTAVLVCLGLVFFVGIAYWQLPKNGFVVCDDPDYIYNNPQVKAGLTWSGFVWAFTALDASNWHPVTWLSHMLDAQLFGLSASGHHFTSLLLHLANTILVFLLWFKLTGALWRSAIVAALFGLHPLHVESVAWASERKDVLCTFFGLLSLMAYAAYARTRTHSRRSGAGYYALAMGCFALGLMSKPMLVTWPFLMLLLDFWPLRRLSRPWQSSQMANLLLEKVPFLLFSASSCLVTIVAQHHGGAMPTFESLPTWLRLENSIVSYVSYLGKTAWPINLAAYYPFHASASNTTTIVALIIILLLTVGVFSQLHSRPYLAVGWLWFLGTLVPVIGIVQVGMQAMADRYTYIPLMGVFVALIWFFGEASNKWSVPISVMTGATLALLAVLAGLTSRQAGRWRDSETLYKHTLSVTTKNPLTHLNLGSALLTSGRPTEAAEQFAEAIRIRPNYAEAMSNLGLALANQGRHLEAVQWYRSALSLRPELSQIHFLLGDTLDSLNRQSEAVREYRLALIEDGKNPVLLNNLAWILATSPDTTLRNGEEAVRLANAAAEATGFQEPVYIGTLAAALAEAGKFGDAIKMAEQAQVLADKAGLVEISKRNSELLQVYRKGKAYREQH